MEITEFFTDYILQGESSQPDFHTSHWKYEVDLKSSHIAWIEIGSHSFDNGRMTPRGLN